MERSCARDLQAISHETKISLRLHQLQFTKVHLKWGLAKFSRVAKPSTSDSVGLTTEIYSLRVLETEVQAQGAGKLGFWGSLSPSWVVFLCTDRISPLCLAKLWSTLLTRTWLYIISGPRLMTTFNTLLNGPISKYIKVTWVTCKLLGSIIKPLKGNTMTFLSTLVLDVMEALLFILTYWSWTIIYLLCFPFLFVCFTWLGQWIELH